MERVHGLRARVIRSLFYLYSPFVSRIRNKGPLDDEPHALKGKDHSDCVDEAEIILSSSVPFLGLRKGVPPEAFFYCSLI